MTSTYPLLRTDRLLLRRWRDEDREPFAALNADPEVMAHFTAPLSREESDALVDRFEAHFDEHGYGMWAVEADGGFVGFTGLQWTEGLPFSPALEVGWRLARHAWGKGYATEAGQAAIGVGLANVGSVVSLAAVTNTRSWAVMERLGMRREGTFEHPRVPEGHPLRLHYLYRIP